jgi:hypothetical protein
LFSIPLLSGTEEGQKERFQREEAKKKLCVSMVSEKGEKSKLIRGEK